MAPPPLRGIVSPERVMIGETGENNEIRYSDFVKTRGRLRGEIAPAALGLFICAQRVGADFEMAD